MTKKVEHCSVMLVCLPMAATADYGAVTSERRRFVGSSQATETTSQRPKPRDCGLHSHAAGCERIT